MLYNYNLKTFKKKMYFKLYSFFYQMLKCQSFKLLSSVGEYKGYFSNLVFKYLGRISS